MKMCVLRIKPCNYLVVKKHNDVQLSITSIFSLPENLSHYCCCVRTYTFWNILGGLTHFNFNIDRSYQSFVLFRLIKYEFDRTNCQTTRVLDYSLFNTLFIPFGHPVKKKSFSTREMHLLRHCLLVQVYGVTHPSQWTDTRTYISLSILSRKQHLFTKLSKIIPLYFYF